MICSPGQSPRRHSLPASRFDPRAFLPIVIAGSRGRGNPWASRAEACLVGNAAAVGHTPPTAPRWTHHEAHLPSPPRSAAPARMVSCPHEDPRWPRGHQCPPRQRAASAWLSEPKPGRGANRRHSHRRALHRASVDFERVRDGMPAVAHVLTLPVHHLSPAVVALRPCRQARPGRRVVHRRSPVSQPPVDDSCRQDVRRTTWAGAVVPKSHARRAVTRSLLKRQIRAAAGGQPGAGRAWVVRLRTARSIRARSSRRRPPRPGSGGGAELRHLVRPHPHLSPPWPTRRPRTRQHGLEPLAPAPDGLVAAIGCCSALAGSSLPLRAHLLGLLAAGAGAPWRRSQAALAAARLVRCHPWCEGGFDPVPGHFLPRPCSAASSSTTPPRCPPRRQDLP